MKKTIVAAGLLGGAALAWAGATQLSSSKFEQELSTLQTHPNLPAQLQLETVSSDRGFTKSVGTLRWTMNQAMSAGQETSNTSNVPHGLIHYTMHHTPGVVGLSRFEAQVLAEGEFGSLTRQATGSNVLLTANGDLGFNGNWHTQFATPRVSMDGDRMNIRIPASSGAVTTEAGGAARYSWELARAAATTPQGRFHAKAIAIVGNVTDTSLGLGNSKLSVQSFEAPQFEIHEVSMAAETVDNAGKLDSVFTTHIGKVDAMGYQFNEIALGFSMLGLDVASLRTVQDTFRDLNGQLETIDKSRAIVLENAIATLLDTGVKFGLTEFQGRSNQGSFGGMFNVALQAGGSKTPLASRLNADGEFTVSESLLPAPFGQMLLGSGYVISKAGSMSTSFRLQNAEVSVNGQPADRMIGAQLAPMLQIADMQLGAWRDGLARGVPAIGSMLPVNLK